MYVSFSKINTTIATQSDKLLKVNHLSVATRTVFNEKHKKKKGKVSPRT